LCLFYDCSCTLIDLPIFIPNEHLYKTHADKGKDKQEIFSWAIRDIISKVGGLKKLDNTSFRNKMYYLGEVGLIRNRQPKPKMD
jgi:hypothetical protein